MKRISLTLLCSLLGIPWPVFAQDATTGNVRGVVEDTLPAQNRLEGVRVFAIDPDSNEYEAVTDSNGEYAITGLFPGRYLMSFYKDGYGAREGKRLTIVAGGNVYMPVKMTKTKPPWMIIFFGGVVLIIGLAIAVISRRDGPSG